MALIKDDIERIAANDPAMEVFAPPDNLGDADFDRLVLALLDNTNLRRLDVDRCTAPRARQLFDSLTFNAGVTDLRLSTADFDVAALDSMVTCLTSSAPSLRHLSFAKCTGLLAARIADVLAHPMCGLDTLAVSACGVTDGGAEVLARALRRSSLRLRRFELDHNEIGDRGALALSRSIEHMSLEHLGLAGNRIGPNGSLALLRQFAQPLAHNLASLDLEDAEIGHSTAEALVAALASGSLPALLCMTASKVQCEDLARILFAKRASSSACNVILPGLRLSEPQTSDAASDGCVLIWSPSATAATPADAVSELSAFKWPPPSAPAAMHVQTPMRSPSAPALVAGPTFSIASTPMQSPSAPGLVAGPTFSIASTPMQSPSLVAGPAYSMIPTPMQSPSAPALVAGPAYSMIPTPMQSPSAPALVAGPAYSITSTPTTARNRPSLPHTSDDSDLMYIASAMQPVDTDERDSPRDALFARAVQPSDTTTTPVRDPSSTPSTVPDGDDVTPLRRTPGKSRSNPFAGNPLLRANTCTVGARSSRGAAFSGFALGNAGAIQLAAAVRGVSLHRLTRLLLHGCSIGQLGIEALAMAVAVHPALVELDLSRNDASSYAAANALHELVANNARLRTLDLASCRLTPAGALRVMSALARNATLTSVRLDVPVFAGVATRLISDAMWAELAQHGSVGTLGLEGVRYDDDAGAAARFALKRDRAWDDVAALKQSPAIEALQRSVHAREERRALRAELLRCWVRARRPGADEVAPIGRLPKELIEAISALVPFVQMFVPFV